MMADAAMEEFDYVFGFGSIINPATHAPWLSSQSFPAVAAAAAAAAAAGNGSTSKNPPFRTAAEANANNYDKKGLPGKPAVILAAFGYQRGWNFRSNTGFTALGIRRGRADATTTTANTPVISSDSHGSDINGVVFQIRSTMLGDFDRREVGYDRVQIPMDCLDFPPAMCNSHPMLSVPPNARVWVYVPKEENCLPADEDHPILQSYVDTVMQGCLFWGDENMAEAFVRTTTQWSPYFLNDTPSSRRPWLYRQQYTVIDKILQRNNSVTHFCDRRHPEEFASAFLMKSMLGAWSIPRRNTVFTGRDKELGQIHGRLTAQRQSSGSCFMALAKLEVCGMAGVGKSQLCTEYCYRYFPSYYGLVIWLQAPSAECIAAGYRQLMTDTNGGGSFKDVVQHEDTDEIVAEVKARLFRSTVPWLLIFDNLEDHSLLDKFLPNGGTAGHVLITTRLLRTDNVDFVGADDQRLVLSCFTPQESVDLLCRASDEQSRLSTLSPKQVEAAAQLAEHLGHLPLALGMAAAYMRKCDVDCSEYLTRYYDSQTTNSSAGGAQHMGHQAVSFSLSLSLEAIQRENPVAWEALRLLGWMGPDQITKKLFRALFVAKNTHDKDDASRRSKLKLGMDATDPSGRLPTYMLLLVGGLVVGSLLTFSIRRPLSSDKVVYSVISGAALAATTSLVLRKPQKMSKQAPVLQRNTSFSNDLFEQTDITWITLKSFSLIVVKAGNGSMHRLLAQALRFNQSHEERHNCLDICVQAVLQIWTFKAELSDTWQESTSVLEHVKTVVAHSIEQKAWSVDTAILSREAGVFSAMALNRFKEAQGSLEQSLTILDGLELAQTYADTNAVRAGTLHELGKVLRYEGNFAQAEEALTKALKIRKKLAHRDRAERLAVAATLHELGVLEVRKHSLDSAAAFLEQALDLRRVLERESPTQEIEADCASTLHQLATVQVARKPPCLDEAESLLTEALGLSTQIGQQAATLKQLARVAIRRGKFDVAERRLAQALELYVELYGENTPRINVAAVKFQQGTLAFQREQYGQAWDHLTECLRTRRQVYAYSQGNHSEVATVLHELGCVAFAQKRLDVACEMLTSERSMLDQLYETSSQRGRLFQALLTNLTWLRKCAKERGREEEVKMLTAERCALKLKERQHTTRMSAAKTSQGLTLSLKQHALSCRLAARHFALAKATNRENCRRDLDVALISLSNEIGCSPVCFIRDAASDFYQSVSEALSNTTDSTHIILQACDSLRDRLRDLGVHVQDRHTTTTNRSKQP